MADFWGGVAKGFGPSYESALARREREEKEEKAEKARKAAAALAAAKVKEDLRRWKAEQERLKATDTESKRRWDLEQGAKTAKVDLDKQIREKAEQQKMEDIRGKLTATGIPQQQEAFKIRGGFPMEGLEPGVDARTLTPTPEQFKGLKRGELVQAQMRATDLQGKQDTIESEQRAKAAKLDPTYQAPKEKSTSVDERTFDRLDDIINEYPTADADAKSNLERQAQVLLSRGRDVMITMDETRKWILHGTPAAGEGGVDAPKETAEQTKTRLQFQHGIIRLDDLIQEADEDDFTGLFPQLKSKLLDEILPALTIDKFADEKRMTFRHRAAILSQNLLRAMNEEGKLSETDAVRILPLTPLAKDDNPMFKAKLKGIRELLVAKLKLQDASAGREDVFSLEPVDFFSKLGKPDERLGGVIVIPQGMATPIIKTMPQYQYIGGDESKPVTAAYVKKLLKDGDITEKQALMWLKNAPGVFRR